MAIFPAPESPFTFTREDCMHPSRTDDECYDPAKCPSSAAALLDGGDGRCGECHRDGGEHFDGCTRNFIPSAPVSSVFSRLDKLKAAGALCPNCSAKPAETKALTDSYYRWSCTCGARGRVGTAADLVKQAKAPTVHKHWTNRLGLGG